MRNGRLNSWLLVRLAAQNISRRKMRMAFLVLSVALAVGVGLASVVLGSSIYGGIASNFSRMGADLLVVPQNTLVNLTSSLLTVQPTEETLDSAEGQRLRKVPGVARVAPQRMVSAIVEGHRINLIAIDPGTDFTVRNWLQESDAGSFGDTSVLAGNSQPGQLGESLSVCGTSMRITGRLHKTGVGPFDESYFVSFAALEQLARRSNRPAGTAGLSHNAALHDHGNLSMGEREGGTPQENCISGNQPNRVTAFLLQLSSAARIEQVKFAISQNSALKVVEGNGVVISSRQGLRTLFLGVIVFTLLLLAALLILVSLLFSAIVQERYRELGLLYALGARSRQVLTMILAEAAMTTSLGGIVGMFLGATILLLFARSLVFYFDTLGVSFGWPSISFLALTSVSLLLFSAVLGLLGALWPAWKARRTDPFALIQAGGR